jgi:hypothetical protein
MWQLIHYGPLILSQRQRASRNPLPEAEGMYNAFLHTYCDLRWRVTLR